MRIALLLCVLALAGPSVFAQAPATKPIKVGAVSTVAVFPEATAAVRAYFDAVNASGGVGGRKLVLTVEDDGGEPSSAAKAARKLEADQVVAHVGSASVLECAVNAGFYEEKNLVSIQGTGVDPACFDSANISPVNTGPYLSMAVALKFLDQVRKRERVCVVTVEYSPLQKPVFERVVATWARQSGRRPALVAIGVAASENPAVLIKRTVDAGCNGVVFVAVESAVIAWVKAAKTLRATGVDWVFLTPAYTAKVAAELAAEGEGIYAMSEFEPWSSRSGMLTDWRSVMLSKGVPLTSLSQGGYAAASVFVSVLRSIKGEITRDAVTAAFKQLGNTRVPLMGTPYAFGPGASHASNRAALPMRLEAGKWVVAHWDYLTFQGE